MDGRGRGGARRCVTAGRFTATGVPFFDEVALNVIAQTVFWRVIFFFAKARPSSAYLTVSEFFPAEPRSLLDLVFFAISQPAGGSGGADTVRGAGGQWASHVALGDRLLHRIDGCVRWRSDR